MELFNFLRKREIGTVKPGLNPATEPQGTDASAESKGGSYQERVARIPNEDAALKVSAYYRGLELRARTMSQLVWSYQRLSREGGNFITDNYGPNRELNYLLQIRPNELTSAAEFAKQLELSIIQQGNGVVYIERDGMERVVALWLCRTAEYDLLSNTYTVGFERPGRHEWLTGVLPGDVLHLRNTFTYQGGLVGIPTLRYMRSVLELDSTNTRLQTETAAKGGRVKLVVQERENPTQGVLSRHSQKEIEKVTRKLNDDIYDYDVSMLSNAAGFQNISMTLADMGVLESRRLTVEDVARFLGVPGYLLGVSGGGGYKGPEAAMQDFLSFGIQPNIRALEDELNSKLLGVHDFGQRRIHVCDQHLRRLDPTGQAKLNRSLLEIGVKTVNELRKEYDQPAVEKGDTPYLFSGLAELGSDKLRNTQATNVKQGSEQSGNSETSEDSENSEENGKED